MEILMRLITTIVLVAFALPRFAHAAENCRDLDFINSIVQPNTDKTAMPTSVTPLLAATIAASTDHDRFEDNLKQLVSALTNNPDVPAYREEVLRSASVVDRKVHGRDWRGGEASQRFKIAQILIARSKNAKLELADRIRYTKAGFNLCAIDYMPIGVLIGRDFSESKQAWNELRVNQDYLAIARKSFHSLSDWVGVKPWRPAKKGIDKLASAQMPGKLDNARVDTALEAMQAWWSTDLTTMDECWVFANAAWVMHNHAVAANDKTAGGIISAQITKWKSETKHPTLQRWFDEAVSIHAPPQRLYIAYSEVDGKTVEVKE